MEVLRHSPSWFTIAHQVVDLVKQMSEEDIEGLKNSYLGGKKLLQNERKKRQSATQTRVPKTL